MKKFTVTLVLAVVVFSLVVGLAQASLIVEIFDPGGTVQTTPSLTTTNDPDQLLWETLVSLSIRNDGTEEDLFSLMGVIPAIEGTLAIRHISEIFFDEFILQPGEEMTLPITEFAGSRFVNNVGYVPADEGESLIVSSLRLEYLIGSSGVFFPNITTDNGIAFLRQGEVIAGGTGVAPVPEPATMLLFGTGLVGLISAQVRRRKK